MNARQFFLDTDNRAFVAGDSGGLVSAPVFFQEDVESIELYFLAANSTSATGYDYVDYSANTVKFAVGTTTPAALQLTWLASSTAITATITTLVTGSAGADEVQKITLSQKPVSGGFAIVMPTRNVTVSSVSAGVFTAANHGLFNGQNVTLTAFSFTNNSAVSNGNNYFVVNRTNGTFSLANTTTATTGLSAAVTSGGGTVTLPEITTPSINYNASPAQVQQAFVDAGYNINGAPQIVVSGTVGKEYTLSFSGACQRIDFPTITFAVNTLSAAPKLAANVNFNTTGISSLIDAGQTAVTLEVEVTDGTKRHTYQTPATLSNDIISSTSPTPTPLGSLGFNMIAGNGDVYAITIDNDGALTATKQI